MHEVTSPHVCVRNDVASIAIRTLLQREGLGAKEKEMELS